MQAKTINSRITFALAALVALAFLSNFVFAQQTTGNIRGIVKDPTGAVVPNAKVAVLDKKTNIAVFK